MHQHKAHVCEVKSLFHHVELPHLIGSDQPSILPPGNDETHRIFADIAKVPESCGGIEQRAMFSKQCSSVGVRPWYDDDDGYDAYNGLEGCQHGGAAVSGCQRHTHLRIWFFSTDQGADQKLAALLMAADVNDKPNVWMLRQWCILHQLQLSAKRQLSRKTFYWSTLAKVVNTWRAPGSALKIFRQWASSYGHERAVKVARTIPPRPLRGRWERSCNGRVHNTVRP